ncbi:MAG: hypothetical protein IPO37_01090 [Saprospiraceae bacterium]|nr:hypothetical protein [Saprospiraceae bacterium]
MNFLLYGTIRATLAIGCNFFCLAPLAIYIVTSEVEQLVYHHANIIIGM